MKITIISDDKTIIVDGVSSECEFEIDPNIWAIHWDSDVNYGTIEYRDSEQNAEIVEFEDETYFSNIHAATIQEKIDADEQERLLFENSPVQIRNKALANITYARPSDGVEIQVRDSEFFPQDESRMTKAINKLEPLGTAPWISKDNQAITVTREDLEAALAYQADEIERIFTDYIATL